MDLDLLSMLAGLALRATIVLAFTSLLTAVMRRAAASARHVAWTCGIAAAAMLPLLAPLTPAWEVVTPQALASVVRSQDRAATSTPAAESASMRNTTSATRSGGFPSRPQAGTPSPDYASLALLAWAAGTFAVFSYTLIGLASTVRLCRSLPRDDSPVTNDARTLAEALGIGRPLEVATSSSVTTPIVCGMWRPLLVMPPDAARWSEDRRHLVLLHELAHVMRRDCLTQLLAQIVCAVYWFNPLAWVAARRLRAERERACDDFVLAAGAKGSEYAAHLLDIAKAAPGRRFSLITAGALSMARRSQLEGRLMAILDPDTRRSSAFLTRCAAALFVCALTVPAAAVHLVPSSSASTVAGQVDPRPLAALDKAAEGSPQPPARPGTAPAESAPPAQAATPPNPALRTVADESLRRTLSRALIEFAGDGDIDGIAGMLAAGAEINAQVDGDGSALIAAAGDGHLDAMRFLLDRGADPNLAVAGEGTALIAAAGDGHVDVVRLLLDRGADPNVAVEGEGTALIAAADDGHLEVVDLLLQRGAQINQVVEGDETALIKAAGEGDLEMVKLLVSRGADVNLGVTTYERAFRIGFRGDLDVSVDREVRTPLSEARDDGHVDVVTFLISAGARD